MVDELTSARQTLTAEQAKTQAMKSQISQVERSVTNQAALRRGGDINQYLVRQRTLQQVSTAKGVIGEREKVLKEFEGNIKAAEDQIAAQAKSQEDYSIALRAQSVGTDPSALTPAQRRIYQNISQAKEDQTNATIKDIEKQVQDKLGQSIALPDNAVEKMKVVLNKNIPAGQKSVEINKIINTSLAKETPPTLQTTEMQPQQLPTVQMLSTVKETSGVVSAAPRQFNPKEVTSAIDVRLARGEKVPITEQAKAIGVSAFGRIAQQVSGLGEVQRANPLLPFGIVSPKTIQESAESFKQQYQYGSQGVDVKQMLLTQPTTVLGVVAGEATIAAGTYGVTKLTEPVVLKKMSVPEPMSVSSSKIVNIQKGEELRTVAGYNVRTVQQPSYAFVTNRLDMLRSKIIGVETPKPSQATFSQLQVAYPQGRIIEVTPARVIVSQTEPFVVRDGQIAGSLRKGSEAGIVTVKSTPRRIGSPIISKLEGTTAELGEIKNINKAQLTPSQQVAMNKALSNTILKSEGSQVKAFAGEVRTTDVLSLTKRGEKVVTPDGRRTATSDIIALQRQRSQANYPTGPLKSITVYEERVGAVDTSFPGRIYVKKSGAITEKITKKPILVTGKSTVFDISIAEPISIESGSGTVTKQVKTFGPNQKVVQKSIVQTAIKQTKELPARTHSIKLPKAIVSPKAATQTSLATTVQPKQSIYYGKGLYERTEQVSAQPVLLSTSQQNRVLVSDVTKLGLSSAQAARTEQVQLNIQSPLTKTAFRPALREESAVSQIQSPSLVTKQIAKQVSGQTTVNKQSQRQIAREVGLGRPAAFGIPKAKEQFKAPSKERVSSRYFWESTSFKERRIGSTWNSSCSIWY